MNKFFKTIITIEILSERKYNSTDLTRINYDITDGDCSGKVEISSYQELTPKEAAKELLAQGSDPEFFNLDKDGNSLDDDRVIGYQVIDANNKGEIHPEMDASFCVYNKSQCREMIEGYEDYWKIVPVMKDTIEEPTLMFEGDPND